MKEVVAKPDSQIETGEFQPSPEQILFAEEFIRARGNLTAACKACGDPKRARLYGRPSGWHYQKGFNKWLSEFCKEAVLSNVGALYLRLLKKSEQGDTKAIELLLETAKELDGRGRNLTVNNTLVKIDVNATKRFLQSISEAVGVGSAGKAQE